MCLAIFFDLLVTLLLFLFVPMSTSAATAGTHSSLKSSMRRQRTFPSTIVYRHIYGELIPCGSRVPYRMSRYFPHTFNVSYTRVRYSPLSLYVLLLPLVQCYTSITLYTYTAHHTLAPFSIILWHVQCTVYLPILPIFIPDLASALSADCAPGPGVFVLLGRIA